MSSALTVTSDNLPDVPILRPHRLDIPPDEHPAAVYIAGLAPGSRRAMTQALRRVADELATDVDRVPWHRLRYQHVKALKARLAVSMAPASVNKILCALRGVMKEAMLLGHMPADEFARAKEVPGVRGSREPKGRALDRGEIVALFEACDPSAVLGARDAAMLAVAYGAVLRRAELVGLNVDDFDADSGKLLVRGKGNKERITYVSNGAATAMSAWLEHRGDESGPLFLPLRKGGHIQRRRMTEQAVLHAFRMAAERAGVARFSPHDLRRTFIGDALDAGADIATVSQMAGHASVTTTARYDRRGDRAKQRAAELLHVPFSMKKAKTKPKAKRPAAKRSGRARTGSRR